MESEVIAYDKAELRAIMKAFKVMDDEAIDSAKEESSALATFVQKNVNDAAAQRGPVASRISLGSVVSKSSKVGEISYGFARQKFSGGGTTQQLWGGTEFGSNKFKQFPIWSGREGRGSKGWFIYPTLRKLQPDILKKWEEAFSKIVKVW
jgi:hypothetical protein